MTDVICPSRNQICQFKLNAKEVAPIATAASFKGIGMLVKQILIVDDELNVRLVVGACLERLAGWNVLAAASGYDGLSLAQDRQPDAILLDMMMPGMDGVSFLQRLRADPTTQAIPVILLTANANYTQPTLFQTLKVSGAIAKPFEPNFLVRQIAETLGWS